MQALFQQLVFTRVPREGRPVGPGDRAPQPPSRVATATCVPALVHATGHLRSTVAGLFPLPRAPTAALLGSRGDGDLDPRWARTRVGRGTFVRTYCALADEDMWMAEVVAAGSALWTHLGMGDSVLSTLLGLVHPHRQPAPGGAAGVAGPGLGPASRGQDLLVKACTAVLQLAPAPSSPSSSSSLSTARAARDTLTHLAAAGTLTAALRAVDVLCLPPGTVDHLHSLLGRWDDLVSPPSQATSWANGSADQALLCWLASTVALHISARVRTRARLQVVLAAQLQAGSARQAPRAPSLLPTVGEIDLGHTRQHSHGGLGVGHSDTRALFSPVVVVGSGDGPDQAASSTHYSSVELGGESHPRGHGTSLIGGSHSHVAALRMPCCIEVVCKGTAVLCSMRAISA